MPERVDAPGGASSHLNGDGSALELCITSGPTGCRYRLIGDPGTLLEAPLDRWAVRQQALDRVLEAGAAQALAPLVTRAMDHWLPAHPEAAAHLTRNVFWLAAPLGDPGLALYLEGGAGSDSEAWDALRRWFGFMVPDAAPARAYVDAIAEVGRLSSVGIEGSSPSEARAKFHWRLRTPVRCDLLGLPLLDDPDFSRFLTAMVGGADRPLPLASLVLSAGFSVATGALVDTKIDVCCCHACLGFTPEQWNERLPRVYGMFGLELPPVAEALARGECQGLFLGFGLDVSGRRRLNLYLMPGGGAS
ncbi:hypothetical protein D7V93_19775 [Corallococcus llansteffanensis]|uniref:Uncharacterized protein n=2 Tax=Corallococcus llansteffanensis TaxID=2316731 RepID=A0A3A8PPJ2_9BACT|nr:hypothetical protein D7V93_19775 [Corallococcus llansteffanensis]